MGGKTVLVSFLLAATLFLAGLLVFLLGPFGDRDPGSPGAPGRNGGPLASDVSGEGGPPEAVAPKSGEDLAAAAGFVESAPEAVVDDSRPVALEGRVLDASDSGVPGARVAAVDSRRWRALLADAERKFSGDPFGAIRHYRGIFREAAEQVPKIETGAEGRYAFRGLEAAEYRIIVTHPQYLPHKDSWAIVKEGATATCDVRIFEGYVISGRVVDKDGKGIGGALVRARPTEKTQVKGIGKLLGAFVDLLEAEILLEHLDGRSREDGSFSAGSLEPVLHDVEVVREGYAQGLVPKVPAGTADVIVLLQGGVSVSGKVHSWDGKPVPGADLELGEPVLRGENINPLQLASQDRDFLGDRILRGKTDEGGAFRIDGVVDGAYELRIRAQGFPPRREPVDVKGAPADLGTILLARAERIAGTVLAASGAGVEGATVFAIQPRSSGATASLGADSRLRAAEGETEKGGAFVLEGLEAGEYDVRAVHAVLGEAAINGVTAGRGDLRLQLGIGATVSGKVLDGGDRTPLEGATVRLIGGSGRSVQTDASGSFEFRGIPEEALKESGGQVFLLGNHAGYQQGFQQVAPGGSEPIEILLSRASGIAGSVLDSAGQPVEGARVWLDVPGLSTVLFMMDPSNAMGAVYTDAQGRFVLAVPQQAGGTNLDVVSMRTGVGRARFGPLKKAGAEPWPEVELVLAPGVALEGRVVDTDGRPVERARVRASLAGELSGEMRMLVAMLPPSGGVVSYSGKDGSYRLGDLDPGPYKVEVAARGYATRILDPVQVGGEGAKQDVQLDPGGTLAGRVVDPEGRPLPRVEVVAFLETAGPDGEREKQMELMAQQFLNVGGTGIAMARTDEEGRYALSHLPEGSFRVVARAPGHETAEAAGLEAGRDVPDLVLSPFARLVGKVTARASGLPVQKFRVDLRRTSESSRSVPAYPRRPDEEFDDPGGAFVLESLPAGEYALRITSAGLAPFTRKVQLSPGAEEEVLAALDVGGRAAGRVRTEDGTPIAEAYIYVEAKVRPEGGTGDPWGARNPGQTDSGGKFVVEGLEPGEYNVRVWHEDYYSEGNRGTASITVPSETEVDLVLARGGKVAGTLEDLPPLQGEGDSYMVRFVLSEEDVRARRERREASGSGADSSGETATSFATSVRDGAYSMGSLPPGRYRVELLTFRRVADGPPVEDGSGPIALGTVDVEAGKQTAFDATVPR